MGRPVTMRGTAFLRLSRLHFLVGGALLYAVGAVTVGVDDIGRYLLGQGVVTSVQLTAQYVNEYFDREADSFVVNRTLFSGGSGVLPRRELDSGVALRAGTAATVVGLVAIGAVATLSLPGAAIALVAIVVAWAYSAPPVRLLDTGWGELSASLVVAAAVPAVGALAQGGPVPGRLLWAIGALVPVHLGMVVAFELPDLEADRDAGKTVLAVRIGGTRAASLAGWLLTAAPVLVVGAAVAAGALDVGSWWAALAALVPGLVTVWAMSQQAYRAVTAAAVATLTVLSIGLILTGG